MFCLALGDQTDFDKILHSYQLYIESDVFVRAAVENGFSYSIIVTEHVRPLSYIVYKMYGWRDTWEEDAIAAIYRALLPLKDERRHLHLPDVRALKSFIYASVVIAAEQQLLYDDIYHDPIDILNNAKPAPDLSEDPLVLQAELLELVLSEAEIFMDDLSQGLAWSPVLRALFYSWHGRELSEEDRQKMSEWLHADPDNRAVYDEIFSGKWPDGDAHFAYFKNTTALLRQMDVFDQRASPETDLFVPELPPESPFWDFIYRWSIPALIVGLTTAFVVNKLQHRDALPKPAEIRLSDIMPAAYGAVLTRADGATLTLDSFAIETLARQQKSGPTAAGYNMITTPRGRRFDCRLPDGSHVWLNAQSTVRYPLVFNGKERRVEVTGGVYLEVVPDTARPFTVILPWKYTGVTTGGSFNIDAYTDVASSMLNITALEDTLRINIKGEAPVTLYAGQEVRLSAGKDVSFVPGEPEQALAWKRGVFYFKRTPVRKVMQQLARWYDVQVIYPNEVPDTVFTGTIDSNKRLEEALRTLEPLGLHFRFEGGRRLLGVTQ